MTSEHYELQANAGAERRPDARAMVRFVLLQNTCIQRAAVETGNVVAPSPAASRGSGYLKVL